MTGPVDTVIVVGSVGNVLFGPKSPTAQSSLSGNYRAGQIESHALEVFPVRQESGIFSFSSPLTVPRAEVARLLFIPRIFCPRSIVFTSKEA
jgi:hypothetical protein